MDYLAWNDAIATRFFGSGFDGRKVFLYVTEPVLAEIGGGEGSVKEDSLQHRPTTLLARLSTTRPSRMAGGDQNRVWRSGKQSTLPTSPHPRLRRDINKTRCATLTSQLVQNIGQTSGTRTYKKRTLGTVAEMPQKRDAERAVASFRANINAEVRVPETVSDLTAHYLKHELTADKKAYATIEATTIYLARHVGPRWGAKHLSDVRTVEVEEWLHSLDYAPATKSKIRNIMSALFNHAIRHEWINRNPITKVRASAKRLREPDVLSPGEFAALLGQLPLREKTMVMLAGSTGLRRSELVALTWGNIDPFLVQVNVLRSCVRNHFGDTKTEASRKPVPLHASVIEYLDQWRRVSPYNSDGDFLFPSIRLQGKQPITPDMVLKKVIRPALVRAGITDKVIGWHSFRHSLATNLRAAGVDLKTAQELLRHANSRITLDVYTRAISANKRDANNKVMEMVLEAGRARNSAPSPAPSRRKTPLLTGSKRGTEFIQHPLAPSRANSDLATVP